MNNKCPKCGERLSPFYMKQNCPKCNTNLVYYNLDKRLQADHEKAMHEQEAVDRVLNNIKISAFGGAVQIIRFVLFFTPLLWMCLPMYTAADGTKITLISVIMGIINGGLPFDTILNDKSYLFPILTMVCIIIFSLAAIISSLFSMGKTSFKRNMIFSSVNIFVYIICVILSLEFKANISYAVFIVAAVYILEFVLHSAVNKKINIAESE